MSKNRLILGQAILLFVVIFSFGLIVVNEKATDIFSPRVQKKIDAYISDNYAGASSKFIESNIKYNNGTFSMKISSTENPDLYFNITYNNGHIKDTYKKDYKEGRTLLNKLESNMNNKLYNMTNVKYKSHFTKSLDKYSDINKEKIIDEDNILNLNIYYLERELVLNEWNYQFITKELSSMINNNISMGIRPKYYDITIIDKNSGSSVTIHNINDEFINNPYKEAIIYNILNKKSIDSSFGITYKYN